MKTNLPMVLKQCLLKVWLIAVALAAPAVMAASTSWKGTSSTAWATAANWTAGVPTASLDAIIGDANFTGTFQPNISATAVCRSLTLGTGSTVSTLTISRRLTVSGNISIGANGTLAHTATATTRNIILTGNWTNSGAYTSSSTSCNVTFGGTSQVIGGANTTAFRRLTINAGSTTTLANNLSVANALSVSGTLDPGTGSGLVVSGAGTVSVASSGKLLVRASTFSGNYSITGTKTLNSGSTIDYAAAGNQTIANTLTYSTLRISGSGVKTLAGNLPALRSTLSTDGNLDVAAGTLDLSTFTANRGTTVAGGTVSVAAGATLKIGGTGTFPANYASHSLAATSTVEYNGANQAVTAETYGHLTLSSAGTATKTMPASALTLAGNLIVATNAPGASVAFTAGNTLTVNGNVSLGAATTFNGSTFSHSVGGNWTNNGTFTGSSSTITMNGVNGLITGTGANNFFNLVIARSGITADANTSLTVAGNFSTTGAGTFAHTAGGAGTVTMSGTTKTIAGTAITFNKLTLTGSIGTADSFMVADNLTVNGSLTASAGTITLSGSGKTISGTGTIVLSGLSVPGSVTTANSFSLAGNLSVAGSFAATAGTVTFNGSSVFTGTASLFNAALNGTLLRLGADSILKLAGTTTLTAGNFDVTNQRPNTVVYNSAIAQTVYPITYDNLEIATGGTKTAGGSITNWGDFKIDAGAVFDGGAGGYTNYVRHHWLNYGTFNAGDSTVEMVGPADSTMDGATTFNQFRVNKDTSDLLVSLYTNDVIVATLDMARGTMNTLTNKVTITSIRTGNDHVLGTITRQHAFSTGTTYAFEGPFTTLSFATLPTTLTSVTVKTALGAVSDFPNGAAINRQYTVSLASSGPPYEATFRAYYQDSETNGNDEASMELWRNGGSSWAMSGKTGYDAASNWVEKSGLTDLSGRWTMYANSGVLQWNGLESTNWATAGNWTGVPDGEHRVPITSDIVQLGTVSATYQPTITTAVQVKGITFGSAQAIALTLGAGGSLESLGNVAGVWTGNITHTISVGAQTFSVGGDLDLSDGTSGHAINLNLGSGTVNVTNNLVQSGGANITCGTGNLNIGGNFYYTSGTFTAENGTVAYVGSGAQTIAPLTYNQLTFNTPSGISTLYGTATVNGNLMLSTGGRVRLNAPLTVVGNVTIGSGTILDLGGMSLAVGGNWVCSGTLNISSGGEVIFNGAGDQIINSCTFHDFDINKSSGTAMLAGNIIVSMDADVYAGTLDLATHTIDSASSGVALSVASGARLRTAGGFPTNFATITLHPASTVEYYGSGSQTIAAETYGHLTVTNDASNPKTLGGPITVAGNLLITNATLAANSYALTLFGNWTNGGTFTAGTGTVVLGGTNTTVAGATIFNNLTVTGTNAVANGDIIILGNATILGGYNAGTGINTIHGDLYNSGTMRSDGTTTFTGTRLQTIQLLTPIQSISTGIVNFNGSVAPVLNSTAPPSFYNVNINNTAGVTASVGWTVYGAFTVASGCSFNGSGFTHTFYGTVANSATMTSSGTLNFNPQSDTTLALGNLSSSGTVAFSGTKQITLTSGALSLGSVSIANTHTAGITPVSNWTLTNDLQIASGATFHAGSGLIFSLAGNFQNNGVFDGGTSLFLFNRTSEIDGSGSTVFNHLSLTGAGSLTNLAPIAITGNFTNNGAFDASGVNVTFTGSSPAFIAGSTTPTSIDSLVIAKSSAAATVSLGVNVTNLSSLTIASGTLDTGVNSVSQDAVNLGVLTVGASGTLKLGGTSTFPAFTTINLDPASTVNYGGGAQIVAVLPYANLILSGSDNKTLATTTTINGNVDIRDTAKFNLTYASGSSSPAGSLTFGGAVQLSGTWGNSGSSAFHTDGTWFAGTGWLNVGSRNLDHFTVTVTSGPQTAGTPFVITTITAQDVNNNTVTDFGGTVDLTETGDGAGGTVTPTQSSAFTAGVLSGFSATLSKAGAGVTITATDHAGTLKSGVSDPFTVNPGAMDHYAVTFSAPPFQTGVPFSTIVTAQDANNNTITTDSSTVVVVSSSSLNMTWEAGGEFNNGKTSGQEDHITKPLTNGVTVFSTRDLVAETATITATSGLITGTSALIDIQTLAGAFRSKTSGDWNAIGTWEVNDPVTYTTAPHWGAANGSLYNHTPTSGDAMITVLSGHTVTVTADVTVDQVYILNGGQLTVNSGVTLTIPVSASPGLEVNGLLHNAGTLTFGSGSLSFVWTGGVLENLGTINSTFYTLEFEPGAPGGTYRHLFATTPGTIPTAEWEVGSVCEIVGYTSNTTPPGGLDQNFHHFSWNCPSQAETITLGDYPTNVVGDFTVTNTGSGALTLGTNLAVSGTATVGSAGRLNCGTWKITGAAFTLDSGGTLGIGSPDGITDSGSSGNIQTTTRIFATDANYTYNGTAAQAAGSGLPSTVNSLTNNTTGTLTLAQAVTFTTSLTLASGAKISLPDGTTSTTAYFVTDGTSQPPGSWGSTGSSAMHKDNTWFAATTGRLNVTIGLFNPALRITAASSSVNGGTSNALTLYLVDQTGATVDTLTGDYNFTFSGLSIAGDGTYPTVTDKTGTAIPLGTPVTIRFTAGQSTAGGSLVAYKAESSKILHATDGTFASSSTGGAEPTLTTLNVSPVAGAASFERNPNVALRIRKSELLTFATDANHDVLTVASVTTPTNNGATAQIIGSYVYYTPAASAGNVTDTFTYTVNDGTVDSPTPATITITVAGMTGTTYNITAYGLEDGHPAIIFAGIPTLPYSVQRTDSLNQPITWTTVHTTNAPATGLFKYIDMSETDTNRFYRSIYTP